MPQISIAGVGLAISAYSASKANSANKDAARNQRAKSEAEAKIDMIRQRKQIQSAISEARIKQANTLAGAQASGASGSSAEVGSVGSIGSQLGGKIKTLGEMQQYADVIADSAQAAADNASKAQGYGSLFKLGGTITSNSSRILDAYNSSSSDSTPVNTSTAASIGSVSPNFIFSPSSTTLTW